MILEATVALSGIAHAPTHQGLSSAFTDSPVPLPFSLFPSVHSRQHRGQMGVLTDIMKLLSYGQDRVLKGPETRRPQAQSALLQSHRS